MHPFVFGKLELLRKFNLEPALKEFISRLQLQSQTESKEDTLRRIETYLIALIISGYNYKYLRNWFELIHEDKEFRERVKNCLQGFIEGFQKRIAGFQYGLETIDMVGRRQPDWEEIKWRELSLVGLEWFMHFQAINWEYSQLNLEKSQLDSFLNSLSIGISCKVSIIFFPRSLLFCVINLYQHFNYYLIAYQHSALC